jgi:putative hydrolases of HD superfamily
MGCLPEDVLDLMEAVHPLDRVARAGYVLRGVAEPESVAAHSHAVALMTLLVARACPGQFDPAKALAMALIHDLPEARLMDIPMPALDGPLGAAKDLAERNIANDMLDPDLAALFEEYQRGASPEARLVRGLDRAQMMARVRMYGLEGRGRLDEFWRNPANFRDYGIEAVSDIFDAVCARAGKERPRDVPGHPEGDA